MPKIYEYLGIVVFFYSNEHEPIHVHGNYNGKEIKAEFIIEDGQILKIQIKNVKGFAPITGNKLRDFEDLISKYSNEIVSKWIDYFVLHKNLECKQINVRLK